VGKVKLRAQMGINASCEASSCSCGFAKKLKSGESKLKNCSTDTDCDGRCQTDVRMIAVVGGGGLLVILILVYVIHHLHMGHQLRRSFYERLGASRDESAALVSGSDY
jgi:hypothetical protein